MSLQVSELGLDQALATDLRTHAKTQAHQISQWLVQLLLSVFQHQANSALANQQMDLSIALPQELVEAIDDIRPLVRALPLPGVSANEMDRIETALACVWLLGNRSTSTLNRMRDLDLSNLVDTRYPVVWLVFGLIALLPLADNSALPFVFNVTLNGNMLTLSVTIR